MTSGRVKWFSNTKKYGFIITEEGKELFVHFTAILGEGYKTLKKGENVNFDVVESPKGEKAVNVTKLRQMQ